MKLSKEDTEIYQFFAKYNKDALSVNLISTILCIPQHIVIGSINILLSYKLIREIRLVGFNYLVYKILTPEELVRMKFEP